MSLPSGFKLLCLLILWRLLSVFVVQTAHVPDEYWQSLEVAHHMVFHYGALTWEWQNKLRSYLYPFLISILYRVLAALSLDSVFLLTTLPRVCQAILVGYSDYRFYKWTSSKWALAVLCTNWYWYYCATRTLINSVETACNIIAFSMYPWTSRNLGRANYVLIASFLCMARPTAAIIWLPLCVYHVYRSMENKMFLFLFEYTCKGFLGVLCTLCIDYHYYKEFVIVPWKFFEFNVLYNVAKQYGEHGAFWYIFAGLPTLLGLYYVPFVMSMWRVLRRPSLYPREAIMCWVILITLVAYSVIPHKEFRFILPLLPLLIHVSSACCFRLNNRMTPRARWSIVMLLMCSNLLPGIYFSVIHQRGTLDVMYHLRDELSRANSTFTRTEILAPCHATPLYSHLHLKTPIIFLNCEPNFDNLHISFSKGCFYNPEYDADAFFRDPSNWVKRVYHDDALLPIYVIVFDDVVDKLNATFLYKYKPIAKLFHTHFPPKNYGKYILLYKRNIYT